MTGKSLANPMQALLAQASASPRDTGESARWQARYNPRGAHVILCDTSGSMAGSAGAHTRIHHVREALAQVARPDHRLLAFSSHVTPMRTASDLPVPSGGTALELGLAAVAEHNPSATLVISDGEPNHAEAALEVAGRLPGRIDVIFCGDESNAAAIAFMHRLARLGGGRCHVHRWAAQAHTPIAATMRLMLAGPGR